MEGIAQPCDHAFAIARLPGGGADHNTIAAVIAAVRVTRPRAAVLPGEDPAESPGRCPGPNDVTGRSQPGARTRFRPATPYRGGRQRDDSYPPACYAKGEGASLVWVAEPADHSVPLDCRLMARLSCNDGTRQGFGSSIP